MGYLSKVEAQPESISLYHRRWNWDGVMPTSRSNIVVKYSALGNPDLPATFKIDSEPPLTCAAPRRTPPRDVQYRLDVCFSDIFLTFPDPMSPVPSPFRKQTVEMNDWNCSNGISAQWIRLSGE